MAVTCIVVDDEPLAKMLIEKYIERTPELEFVASYTSATEAKRAIEEKKAELAFLDIQMPGLSGMQLAKIAEKSGVKVVFTTAHRDYAIEGFRVNAVDYLLKPVSYDEFLEAVRRVCDTLRNHDDVESRPEYIALRSNYRTVRVKISEIIYIEGLRDYAKVHLENSERPLLTQLSLKSFEDILPSDEFVRVHRSYIVALKHIERYSRTNIYLDLLALSFPIGDTYRPGFMKLMTDTFGNQ